MEASEKTTEEEVVNPTPEVISYKSNEQERYDEILEQMHRCCLCGGELDFHHETDYIMLTVREEAHCPSCGIRTKKDSYTIQ